MLDRPTTSSMQRKDEILVKKAKLAELKRQRELRQKEFSATRQSIGGSGASETTSVASPTRSENREELDSLVASLIGDGKTAATTPPRTPTAFGHDRRTSRITSRQISGATTTAREGDANSSGVQVTETGTQTLSLAPLRTVYEIRSEPLKREVVTYSKGVQVSPSRLRRSSRSRSGSAGSTTSQDDADGDRRSRRKSSRRQAEKEDQIRESLREEIEAELRGTENASAAVKGHQNFPARALDEEEREAVTGSNDFMEFIERSSKVIERALDEDYDVLADYRLNNRHGYDEDDGDELGTTGRKGRRVREILQFYDERWSKRRIISDIDFSSKYPELVLSSHTKNPSAPYDPPGLIQVWNTHMKSRPEHIFHANSDILTAKFSPFHPNLIIGGTYSGQVLLWDTRSRTSQHHPVQKTPLTGTGYGHTHPIYSINVIGTQNAHNIISTSTDGITCSWSVDMLSRPQEYLELTTPSSLPPQAPPTTPNFALTTTNFPQHHPPNISPLTTAFPPTDPSYYLTGTESGLIHLIHRHARAGTRAGVDAQTAYVGHAAPVMSLDFHRASGPLDLGDLMLSAGMDWSVRLWRVRTPNAPTTTTTTTTAVLVEDTAFVQKAAASYTSGFASAGSAGQGQGDSEQKRKDVFPLLTVARDEPVYDARFSPTRPGVWASVDGAGGLEVWDLNGEDWGVPVCRVVPTQRDVEGNVIPKVPAGVKTGAEGLGISGGVGSGSGSMGGSGRRFGTTAAGGRGKKEEVGKSLNKCAWSSDGKLVAVGGLDGVLSVFEVGGELGGLEGVRSEEWSGVKKLITRLEGQGGRRY